jgi:hypothetical protein
VTKAAKKKKASTDRELFGPAKYAGFHLLLSRWLRLQRDQKEYCYVTLGGTELRDCESFFFIDNALFRTRTSYEKSAPQYALAVGTQNRLAAKNVNVSVVKGDIISYQRTSDLPHVFFLDFKGIIFGTGFDQFATRLFESGMIQPGDTIFLTSHCGRNVGYDDVFENLSGEFSVLGIDEREARKDFYRWAHPTITLFRGLNNAGMESTLSLRCIGAVRYFDTSSMCVWGYVVGDGRTDFLTFVRDSGAVRYDVADGFVPLQ